MATMTPRGSVVTPRGSVHTPRGSVYQAQASTTPRGSASTTPRGSPSGTGQAAPSASATPRRRNSRVSDADIPTVKETNVEPPLADEELLKVFKKIDLDGSGSLELDELEKATRELGVKCSSNCVKKVFRQIDIDKSGSIDFEEFRVFFGKVNNPDAIKDILSASSARFLDYRFRVEHDPSFTKHFPVPQTIKAKRKYAGAHSGNVESVAFIGNNQFVSASSEGLVLVWDVTQKQKYPTPIHESPLGRTGLYSMDVLKNGNSSILVGFGNREDNLILWDYQEKQQLSTYAGHSSPVYSCQLWGNLALSGDKEGLVCMHDLERSQAILSWKCHDNVVNGISFSPDDKKVCSASRDGQVQIQDAHNGDGLCLLEDAAAGYAVNKAIWYNDHEVITCGDDYCIKRWDIRMPTNPPVESYLGHTSGVKTICLSPDNTFLVSGDETGGYRMWFANAQKTREELSFGEDDIRTKLEKLYEKKQEAISRVEAGEADPKEVRDLAEEIAKLEGDAKMQEDQDAGSKSTDGTTASFCLPGHSMAGCTVAWQDGDDSTANVVTGAQDESMCLFQVDRNVLLGKLNR
eukprot:TRINITY_DN48822_c0_g1_i1.p1 TRINITY_DN48822_c0_g1~~TRINITY_DN48822_c0_g1_i1.p1  ORF type:complete len:576 (+),score=93.95 TRINITY_DN48822_c0_g1_i1:84-1811(+)